MDKREADTCRIFSAENNKSLSKLPTTIFRVYIPNPNSGEKPSHITALFRAIDP